MFGSVYPHSALAFNELDRIKAAGLKGIKLHCESQNFDADDKSVFPIYDKISSLNLPLILHGGTDAAYLDRTRCTPKMVREVLNNFPNLKVIVAHLAGYREVDQTLEYLAGYDDVYLDTSLSHNLFTRDDAFKIIDKHGEDKLLFGSDCPWGCPLDSIKFIDSLKISDSKKQAILGNNAKRLLSL